MGRARLVVVSLAAGAVSIAPAAGLAAGWGSRAAAQAAEQPAEQPVAPQNPVFVADSPVAAEALARASDQLRAGNFDPAVRLLQDLLDREPDSLVEGRDGSELFEPVRRRAHEMLLGDAPFLARYRTLQDQSARELLAAGEFAALERSRLLTTPGLEAALRLAQDHLEAARFDAALRTLMQLRQHPDLQPAGGPGRAGPAGAELPQAAAELARILTAYVRRPEALALAAEWAPRDPRAGDGAPRPVEAPIEPPPAALVRARTPLEPAPPMGLDELVPRALRSTAFARAVPEAPSRGMAEQIPPTARELSAVPTVAGDRVYVAGGRLLLAADRATLRDLWRTDLVQVLRPDEPPGAEEGAGRRGAGLAGEELTVVSAAGSSVVVAMTLNEGRMSDSPQWIFCVEAATGAVRWRVTPPQLDAALAGASVRGQALIDGGTVVVALRKVSTERRLTALYLAGLDAQTGALRWLQLVGSAGSLPYYRREQASDGGILHEGVVYRPDRLGVLAAYAAHDGRPLWVRRLPAEPIDGSTSSYAWQAALPLLHAGRLMVLTPDRSTLLVLDPATGAELQSIRLGAAGMLYALIAGEHLVLVGERSVATRPLAALADGGAMQEVRFDGPGIRGRVTAMGGLVLAPLATGVALIDPAAPDAARVIPIDNVGNVLPDGGRLLVADDVAMHAYYVWPAADRMLEAEIVAAPQEADAGVTLAEVAARVGRLDRVARGVRAAAAALAGAEAGGMEDARVRLVALLRQIVEQTHADPGDAPAGDGPRPEPALVTEFVDRLAALARTPEERAAAALVAGTDLERRGLPAQAAAAWQGVLLDPALAAAFWTGPRGAFQADSEATRRLERLVATAGRERAYAAFDAAAAQAAAALPADAAPAQVEELARQYPLARAAAPLWQRAAAGYAGAGLARAEARALELGLQAGARLPDADPAVAAELAGRLLENLRGRGLTAAAREVLRAHQARFPGVGPTVAGAALDSAALATALEPRDAALRRWPRAGLPIEAGAQVLPGWGLMEAELQGSDPRTPAYLALRHEDNRVAIYAPPTGKDADPAAPLEAVWTSEKADEFVQLVRADADAAIFYSDRPGGGSLWRLDVAGRAVAWTGRPFPSYFENARRADPPARTPGFRMPSGSSRPWTQLLVCADDRTVAVVDGAGRAVCLDADSGAPLWTAEPGVGEVYDADLLANLLVIAGRQYVAGQEGRGGANVRVPTDVILLVDARSGDLRRRIVSPAGGVRWVRLSDRGDLLAGLTGAVACFDLESGQPIWTLRGHPAASTTDAWTMGETLVVMAEDRALWQVGTTDGQVRSPVPQAKEIFETNGAIRVNRTQEGGLAFRSPEGLMLVDRQGMLVGVDALAPRTDLMTPQPVAAGYLVMELGPGPAPQHPGLAAFAMHLLDGRTARVEGSVGLALGAAPQRIQPLDGRVAVSAGHSTIVYQAPAGSPAPAP